MKRKSHLTMLGAGFAIAVAALSLNTPKATYANRTVSLEQNQEKQKALADQTKVNHRVVRENVGGLDLVQRGEYGMSPMEYGMRFGNGKSRKGKTNFKKVSHSYKVKRR